MKYCTLKASYPKELCAYNNFTRALIRIGEIDPLHINRTTLKRKSTSQNNKTLKQKDYYNRGVLTIRYTLNRNLGKNGKFTNRMIRITSCVKKRTANLIYSTKLPKDAYVKIAVATYNLLSQYDPNLCKLLIQNVIKDEIDTLNKEDLFTIAPVQTDIVMLSTGKTDEIQQFLDITKSIIFKGEYNG